VTESADQERKQKLQLFMLLPSVVGLLLHGWQTSRAANQLEKGFTAALEQNREGIKSDTIFPGRKVGAWSRAEKNTRQAEPERTTGEIRMEDDPIPHGFNPPLERTGSHTGREQNKSSQNEKRPSAVERERRPVPGPQHSAPEETALAAQTGGKSKRSWGTEVGSREQKWISSKKKNEQHKTKI
jgi:hypothetical protein